MKKQACYTFSVMHNPRNMLIIFIAGFAVIATTGTTLAAVIKIRETKKSLPAVPLLQNQIGVGGVPTGINKKFLKHGAVKRSAVARINFGQFKELKKGKQVLKGRIPLQLFENLAYNAIIERSETLQSGKIVGRGKIENMPNSIVSIVVNGETAVANIYTGSVVYEIRRGETGEQVVYEVDPSKFPRDGHLRKKTASTPVGTNVPTATIVGTSATTTIDVMILYTREAREAAGSEDAIRDLIDLAIADANLSYENSLVKQQLNLVHAAEISYNESNSFETDLDRLETKNDGYLESVHALRDQYAADAVTLFIADAADYCGMSDPMDNVNYATQESRAFTVVELGCLSNLSFVHELGHVMGAQHDPATSSGEYQGRYSYSQAYQDTGASFRTVMAYDCPRRTCIRLPFFSTPNVTFGSGAAPLGAATQDNARTLNNTRSLVGSFRGPQDSAPSEISAPATSNKTVSGVDFLQRVTHPTDTFVDSVQLFVPFASSSADSRLSQTFIPTQSMIEGFSFVVRKQNNPNVLIRADIKDRGTVLGTATLLPSAISAVNSTDQPTWTRVDFREPLAVTPGSAYQLVFSASRVNTRNNYALGAASGAYNAGSLAGLNASLSPLDIAFKIHYQVNLNAKLP